jgi:hypothetical protein
VVATIAVARVDDVLATSGAGPAATGTALTEGFQRATLVAACLSLLAAVAAGLLLRRAERRAPAEAARGTVAAAAIADTGPTAEPALAGTDEIAG